MKAIETRYAGHRFRSRLEARWAVFFDHLGVEWEYEPQGYVVGGTPYLPDFRLLNLPYPRPVLFEVKGPPLDDDAYELMLHRLGVQNVVLVAVGQIPRPDRVAASGPVDSGGLVRFGSNQEPDVLWWTVCPGCGTVGTELEALAGQVPCGCAGHGANRGPRSGDHPRILAALTAARSARFEHGESGAPRAEPEVAPVQSADLSGLLADLFRRREQQDHLCAAADPDAPTVTCTRPVDHYGRHMGVSSRGETHVWGAR